MAATERLHQQRNAHTQSNSLQSSSVPSTPHQIPRDLRFPSRSPSPGRPISGRRSPRSAAKETSGVSVTQPAAPVICKFESGAEFRKRRIPYKDGGNEPLPPPSTEPKKAQEPHEDNKLSGDMRELYDRLLPSQESEERRAKLIKKLEKILNDEWPGNDIKVNVFGSSGNLLSSSDSDVDICITTPLKSLESMHSLATILHQHGMERVVCRAAAKVPIVKIWDPELQLACDMNVNNTLALENTRMIKTYVEIDDRVRPLAKIIKYWTKQRILNDAAFGGTISSYTWICMIINFLQSRDPPILPSLQRLDDSFRSTINGKPSPFADNIDKLKSRKSTNNESLGSLLFHFFRYYGYELDYSESVVSVKEGRVLTRKEKGWAVTNYQDKEARVRLCVEEPFNTNRNLGNSADDYAFSGIHEEIRRAFDLIAAGKFDECCTEYVFPPEEKPLFQRPAPKPKPILTRSASQSGRAHANSVGAKSAGKESRNNRTSSSHRGNNRRASSGATFGNPRFAFMSPPVGMAGADYFGPATAIPNDQLHEQLYKQYQFLQAQQELLRSQLLQQQQNQVHMHAAQAHAQAHGLRTSDFSTASPRQRQFAHSVSSPRTLDTPPATAPLLPGYLYHYPARHAAPASPLSQTRSQEGSATNPSSPSVSSNAAALRRGAQRANAAEGTAPGSVRSQSQPGRSFPSPATLQSVAHPGFDVSGAIGSPFLMRQPLQMYPHQQNGYDMTAPLSAGGYPVHFDSAMPKEYVGYYLGQSPQLLPQQPLNASSQVPILRDVKPRQPRTSPDQVSQNRSNGTRRKSRSPSPLTKRRSSSVSTSSRSAPLPQMPFPEGEGSQPKTRHPKLQDEGPVIVNGSTPQAASVTAHSGGTTTATLAKKMPQSKGSGAEGAQNTTDPTEPHTPERKSKLPSHKVIAASPAHAEPSRPISVPDEAPSGTSIHVTLHPSDAEKPATTLMNKPNGVAGQNPWHSGTNVQANIRARPPPPLNLSPARPSGDESLPSPVECRATQISPLVAPPLLSPVAELQTPSPTSSRGHGSPHNEVKTNANMNRNVQIANGKLNERVNAIMTNGSSSFGHRLMPENPLSVPSTQVQQSVPTGNMYQPGEWQQATRKNKKGKSQGIATTGKDGAGVTGEAMPASENERKGG